MDSQVKRVFVALGNDLQDGYRTLEWTLRKWNSQPISITILHVAFSSSRDLVQTPFGKLPPSAVNDETLKVFRKHEQEKIDELLSKYRVFCGKVKSEVVKVGKSETPVHKLLVDLITKHQITKLVMGITLIESSSRRLKNAISGSLYIYQHKPEFCELYVLCEGRLVYLNGEKKEDNLEDEQGVPISKLKQKASFKNWLGRVFSEPVSPVKNPHRVSISSTKPNPQRSRNHRSSHAEELENYYQQLLSSNLDEEDLQEHEVFKSSSAYLDWLGLADLTGAEKIEALKRKIKETQEALELNRREAEANGERCRRAEWAITQCNQRAEDLEKQIKDAVSSRMNVKKHLDVAKEQLMELINDAEEGKRRVDSLMELQYELSNRLLLSTHAKSHAEAQLEKTIAIRADTVREIEELRKQRDIFRRRIDFCRDKDAIGMMTRLKDITWSCKDYMAEDIRLATDHFSDRLRLKVGGELTNVYRGHINHATVAIKMLNSPNGMSEDELRAKVELLRDIRHPHLVALIGFCSELKCVVFEYMHNGSLGDILFPPRGNTRRKVRTLQWQERIRVATEICSALAFLHSTKPKPIFHGHLTLSDVLLDRNLVAKIRTFGLNGPLEEPNTRSDVRAFGVLMLHLLTGRNWPGLLGESMKVDMRALVRFLDGPWPCNLAREFAWLAVKCLSDDGGPDMDLNMDTIMVELNGIKKKADALVARKETEKWATREDHGTAETPSYFICPIFQEIMKNPHVAADGFSYELEAIEEWLGTGSETSPMTNLKLRHKHLTPNHTLRSLIEEWQTKTSSENKY